ncbi:YceD family protein [Anoxybacteroides amylolyticum]|uniref:DUF177 domain-containing protein n=1 Tax=Anoxybacteroides amylolyticum TaxID=294699 RepID=A0A160F2D1_9BACL|nr:DUF177 domain-containing protein [Anoxybacillus amylolyticus]ANB60378.1 hypothetical protein GFC30_1407 [Anoxybacillus amylolyticus]
MKWSIHQLHQLQAKGLAIEETVDVSDLKQIDKLIRDISPIHVEGRADISATKFTFHLTIEGTMVLPCSRTLVDVSYPFTIQTTETFFLNDYDVDPDEDTHLVQGDSIDLLPIVKELVLLEIPMQVFAEQPAEGGAPQAGVGWEVITEEQLKEKIDPRLAGLAKFFEQKEE